MPEAYIAVGYDDVHPTGVGLPISATDFTPYSEEYAYNLVHRITADLALILSGGAALAEGKRVETIQVTCIATQTSFVASDAPLALCGHAT